MNKPCNEISGGSQRLFFKGGGEELTAGVCNKRYCRNTSGRLLTYLRWSNRKKDGWTKERKEKVRKKDAKSETEKESELTWQSTSEQPEGEQ